MTKEEINSIILTMSGKAELEELLESGHDYIIGATVHCKEVGKNDEPANGKFDMICKTALLGQITIEDDLGRKFYGKVKGSPSQLQRWMMNKIGMDYHRDMAKIRRHPDEFKEFVDQLD